MNNRIIEQIYKVARFDPNRVALESLDSKMTYKQLCDKVDEVANYLVEKNHRVAAVMARNCFEWVIFDLSCLKAGVNLIAIADFFSKKQIENLLKNASPTIILHEKIFDFDYEVNFGICKKSDEVFGFKGFSCLEFSDLKNNIEIKNPIHEGCAKITYTSGSSSQPKGICLRILIGWFQKNL